MPLQRRDKDDNPYEQLQRQSLRMLQQLSGEVWTDFNVHDPGVTLMDALNYGLLECKYRMDFDFGEYLGNPVTAEIDYAKMGLLPAAEIFAPCVVTPLDYEHLFMQQISEIRECEMLLEENNLYTIRIGVSDEANMQQIQHDVTALYHANRNLCENLKDVNVYHVKTRKKGYLSEKKALLYHQEKEIGAIDKRTQYTYSSVQNELPDCYGVNQKGLLGGATPERKAKALQLKAYLLIFDYLLSGVGQQTKSLYKLLELSGNIPDKFSFKIDVTDLDLLLDKDKVGQEEYFKIADFNERKASYFDLLDVLYGEQSEALLMNSQQPLYQKNKLRAQFIRQLPGLNTDRFRSFNLLDGTLQSMPGVKRFISVMLGIKQPAEIPLVNIFSRYNIRLVSDNQFYNEIEKHFQVEFILDENELERDTQRISKIPHLNLKYNEYKYYTLKNQLNFFWRNVLFEGFLEQGTNLDNYRIYKLEGDEGFLLLYRQPGRKEWINMGLFFKENTLIQTINYFISFLERLNTESMSIYIIEHLLLCTDTEKQDEAYKVTIIIPRWTERYYQRYNYQELIQDRLPAHIEARFLWLDVESMYHFEAQYYPWRKALASGNKEKATIYAEALWKMNFLTSKKEHAYIRK